MTGESDNATRSKTKYGDRIEDHDWSTPESDVEEPERTHIDSHEVEVIYVTDPSEDMGYGREKYTTVLSYDDETDDPFVLYAIEHRWKGNYWRDMTDWNWSEVPEPVRQQVAAVLPVDGPEALDPGVQLMDEGGESRWEKIHKPRIEAMKDDDATLCTICGVDLTNPKNGGDPTTEDGEWVCNDPVCRSQVELSEEIKP
jgi:hypothetical protein